VDSGNFGLVQNRIEEKRLQVCPGCQLEHSCGRRFHRVYMDARAM
jgi:hypothetical protein